MEFPDLPIEIAPAKIPQGLQAPMCLCGDPCNFSKSVENGDTYGLRFWSCVNYASDRCVGVRNRPEPLCEFVQYHDTKQTPEMDTECHVKFSRRREMMERRWREIAEEDKREKFIKRLKAEKDAQRKAEEQHEAEEREAELERKRARAQRARQDGPSAFEKGKYPRSTQ